MRSAFGLAALLLISCLASAAEPAKVSVYPAMPVTSARPAETATVLPGTLVPVRADVPMPMAKPETPAVVKPAPAVSPSPAPVPPTVSAVTISSCGACETKPCGTTFFRGRSIASSCGADVCSSPGRPALFGGLFGPSCSTCPTGSACSSCDSTGACCPRVHAFFARLKAWILYRPCDGPRAGLFRCEPYMPRTMTVFPCRDTVAGTCHSAGGCVGSGCGSGLGSGALRGAIANGSLLSGRGDGNGLGLADRLLPANRRTPTDCNNSEPKLSGTKFEDCYHFARATPMTYGCRANQTNGLGGGGCATTPMPVAVKTPERVRDELPVQRASAVMPAPKPSPAPPMPVSAAIPVSQLVRPVAVVTTPQPIPPSAARPMSAPAAPATQPVSAAETQPDYVMVAGWRLPKNQAPK